MRSFLSDRINLILQICLDLNRSDLSILTVPIMAMLSAFVPQIRPFG